MHEEQRVWDQIVGANSFCTTSPVVGEWVLKYANKETKEGGKHTLGLGEIAKHVVPELSYLAGTRGPHSLADEPIPAPFRNTHQPPDVPSS